jgi:exopolyphosphatase/guanosine-5'-triphosphate,3'-diphosphate pyrophosphatase
MATIIPRWEWRTFGSRFGMAEDHFGALTPAAVQESDELYLLSGEGANVKVRAGRVDVKILLDIGPEGLERWGPLAGMGFPLAAAGVVTVFDALRLPVPPLARHAYTLDQLVTELVPRGGPVRAVAVHKRRLLYGIGGCTAEVADVVADGRATRTIAIESEDAEAVSAAVRALGLEGYLNTSYPRGLAALIAGTPPRYAVVDVGTNSVKLYVGEGQPDGSWRTIVDRADLSRLGEGLRDSGAISPEALARTVTAIADMVDEARRDGVLAIAAVGTAGFRIARNRDTAIAAIAAGTGVTVEVIPGEEEGRLAYLAVKAAVGLAEGALVVFDAGGGSIQITLGRGTLVDERFSVDVGAVRYTEQFRLAGVVTPEVLRDALAAISADLSRLDGRQAPDALVAMGGTVTNLAAVKHGLATYDPEIVRGTVLDRAEIGRQVELYSTRDLEARRAIVGLQPKRADVILAGACIVRTVMEKLGQESLMVSDRGIRHELLVERFGG